MSVGVQLPSKQVDHLTLRAGASAVSERGFETPCGYYPTGKADRRSFAYIRGQSNSLCSTEASAMADSSSQEEDEEEQTSDDMMSEDPSESAFSSSTSSSDTSEGDSENGDMDDRVRSHKHASPSRKRGGSGSLLTQTTNKAAVQANEDISLEPIWDLPEKPMLELIAGSNTWYQAYIVKRSANEVKFGIPAHTCENDDDQFEWIKRTSSRIWRGTLSMKAWRHLGKGAWRPKVPQIRHPEGGKLKKLTYRTTRGKASRQESRSGLTGTTDGDLGCDLSYQDTSNKVVGPQCTSEHHHEEIVSPSQPHPAHSDQIGEESDGVDQKGKGLPGHIFIKKEKYDGMKWENGATNPKSIPQHQANEVQGIRFPRCHPNIFWMTDMEPGDARKRPTRGDPLAKWFELHYSLMMNAGKLGLPCPVTSLEAGALPRGFWWNPATRQFYQDPTVHQEPEVKVEGEVDGHQKAMQECPVGCSVIHQDLHSRCPVGGEAQGSYLTEELSSGRHGDARVVKVEVGGQAWLSSTDQRQTMADGVGVATLGGPDAAGSVVAEGEGESVEVDVSGAPTSRRDVHQWKERSQPSGGCVGPGTSNKVRRAVILSDDDSEEEVVPTAMGEKERVPEKGFHPKKIYGREGTPPQYPPHKYARLGRLTNAGGVKVDEGGKEVGNPGTARWQTIDTTTSYGSFEGVDKRSHGEGGGLQPRKNGTCQVPGSDAHKGVLGVTQKSARYVPPGKEVGVSPRELSPAPRQGDVWGGGKAISTGRGSEPPSGDVSGQPGPQLARGKSGAPTGRSKEKGSLGPFVGNNRQGKGSAVLLATDCYTAFDKRHQLGPGTSLPQQMRKSA